MSYEAPRIASKESDRALHDAWTSGRVEGEKTEDKNGEWLVGRRVAVHCRSDENRGRSLNSNAEGDPAPNLRKWVSPWPSTSAGKQRHAAFQLLLDGTIMASHGVSRTAGAGARSEEMRHKELQQIEAYRELVHLVNTKIAERQYTFEVLALTTKLLNENPEYYTIWNHRRRVLGAILNAHTAEESPSKTLEQLGEELVSGDLQLTFTLLRKFPKCYWLWNHRNWTLIKAEGLLKSDAARKLWSGELQLVGKMLTVDSRNFHAWGYRRFVVAQLERLSPDSPHSWVESEFEYTTKMIKTNLSNFSAWHNRSQIIPRLLGGRGADSAARKKLLDDELTLICTAINTDPFDQSIWYYHQYLMSTLSPDCARESRIALDLTNQDRQNYYAHEMEYIREILEDETDCKWIYEGLLGLAASYLEVDADTKAFTTLDMRSWLEQLKRLDPLRTGRWEELAKNLGIE